MEIGEANIKGELPYNIQSFLLFYKRGRKFFSNIHTFGFTKQQKMRDAEEGHVDPS
jgi:hypothetical protein